MPAGDDFDFPDLPELDFGELPDVAFAEEADTPTVPDPLAGLRATGSLEVDSKAEISATLQGFRDRAKAEQERMDIVTDSEYWFAVCFQSREQKEEFLRAVKMLADGDKYLDGRKLAANLGIILKCEDLSISKPPRIDAKLAKLAL